MKKFLFFVLVISLSPMGSANAADRCVTDYYGQLVCAPPGGGAAVDSHRQAKIGVGECVRDYFDQIMCSQIPGGGAALDSRKLAVCEGGCVPGRVPDR